MKKTLALLLTLVFVFALSACDNKGEENSQKQKDNPTSATQSDMQKNSSELQTNQQSGSQSQNKTDTTASQNSQTNSNTNLISRDRAIELALKHAGLNKADVRDLEAELDVERGGKYWEIDFESGNLEYSYDINAETEEIRKVEKEKD